MPTIKSLYLSYDGLTDPLGQSQILPYLAGLSQEYRITILSFEKKDRFEKGRAYIQHLCESANLTWIPLCYHKRPRVISTLYDLYILRKKCQQLLKKENFQLVHCRSYLTSLIGLKLKKNHGLKFIFDMRGFWADERVEGGIWNLSNPIFRIIFHFFKKKEKEFLHLADHIVSLTESAKNEIRLWNITTPVTVIPTCVDLSIFNRDQIQDDEILRVKRELGIASNEFVLVYLGSWGTWYLTPDMFAFFSMVRKNTPAKFLILSTDNVNTDPCEFAEDVMVKAVKREDVPLYLSLARAAIALIKPSFSKKASSATKIGEYLAMGLPVVTNAGWGDIEQLSSESVFLLNDLSSHHLTQAATYLLQMENVTPMKMNGHALDLSTGVRKYLDVYRRTLL